MNPRLIEIAAEAGMKFTFGEKPDASDFDIELFSNLLLSHCVGICENRASYYQQTNNHNSTAATASEVCGQLISEYFSYDSNAVKRHKNKKTAS